MYFLDDKTLELVIRMPEQMLAVWDLKHPASESTRSIATDFKRREKMASRFETLCLVVSFGVMFASLWFTASPTYGLILLAVGYGMFLYIMKSRHSLKERIWHLERQSETIRRVEDALQDPSLNLWQHLERDRDWDDISEEVYGVLVSAAREVTAAEERFGRMRRDKRVTDKKLTSEGMVLSGYRSTLDRKLELAAEFGLSDGNPRRYFEAAQRNP